MMNANENNNQIRDKFLEKPEVCALLGITTRTVDNYMKRGILPYIKFGSAKQAQVRFKLSDIEAHLNQSFRVVRNAQH